MAKDTRTASSRPRNPRGQGKLLRLELVLAAARLLAEHPVETLTLRGVASEAGVSPMSVYRHFATLDELVFAVRAHLFGAVCGKLDQAAAHREESVSAVSARADAFCRFGMENPGHYRFLFEHRSPVFGIPADRLAGAPLWQAMVEAVRESVCMAALTEEQLHVITATFVAALHGAVALRINMPSFPWPPLDDVVELARTTILPGAVRSSAPARSLVTSSPPHLDSSRTLSL